MNIFGMCDFHVKGDFRVCSNIIDYMYVVVFCH